VNGYVFLRDIRDTRDTRDMRDIGDEDEQFTKTFKLKYNIE
jgi:hypothetical protein